MNKKLLAAAIASAVAVPTAAQAVDFKVSGQVNRALRLIDDGQASSVQHVDNGASGTRVRFVGSEKFGNGDSAGVNLELGISSNSTQSVQNNGDGANSISIRHSAVWYGGDWGKLFLGHTSDSYDGVQSSSKSGVDLADGLYNHDAQGTYFRTTDGMFLESGVGTATGTASGSIGISSVFSTQDGSRNDVIRYDTPALGPVSASISHGNNSFSGRIVFSNKFANGADLKVQLGGRDQSAQDGNTDIGLSAGLKLATGTNFAYSVGSQDTNEAGETNGELHFFQIGHNWGSNAVAVSYNYAECYALNAANDNSGCDEGRSYGIGWVHTIKKLNAEVYASLHRYKLDLPASLPSVEDVDALMVGTRIKFK